MTGVLQHHTIKNYRTASRVRIPSLEVSYRIFGKPLHTAPVVLINHALTGNSLVTGAQGWWSEVVKDGGIINTEKYTIIAIDIPGNGHSPRTLINNYKDYNTADIATIYKIILEELSISKLHAVIGLSLGGGIAWELVAKYPDLADYLIAIATDWRATDWILAHCKAQEQILNNSKKPVHDARMMAMLFYRTAASFKEKFNRTKNENLGIFNVESWLLHHGYKLEQRFSLPAYKMVNHLLSTLDITRDGHDFTHLMQATSTQLLQIGIDSDFFFVADSNSETHKILRNADVNSVYQEITSIHGHDGFLVEHAQLATILKNYF